ncbi:hypothetical protein VZQ01_31370 [Myxococcus faecalis]|uniref:hypothetical protein n=1 Tax=Myxococcus faecalis TaxID=3115646 RepID=UPI003CF98282
MTTHSGVELPGPVVETTAGAPWHAGRAGGPDAGRGTAGRPLMLAAGGAIVVLVVVVQVISWSMDAEQQRLRSAPTPALAQLRAEEAEALGRYRWLDAKAGVVQVPIERAMERVLERGRLGPLPARGPVAPPPPEVAPTK